MTTIRSKLLDLVKQTDRSELSLGERVKLRIALRFAPRKLVDEIAAQAMAEGFLPAGCDINEAADGTFGAQGLVTDGLSRQVVLVLGLAAAVGYWPYRKAKVRRLWAGHCKAVAEEQKRRAARGAPSSGERQSGAG